MERKFTKNDVLRYLWREMPPAEEEAFLHALTRDEDLWQEFEALKDTVPLLDDAVASPSARVVQDVKAFARESIQKKTGHIFSGRRRKFYATHLVLASLLVFFTAGASLWALYAWKMKTGEELISRDQPRLQWDNPRLDARIQQVKFTVKNLESGNREVAVPVIHNTYRLINVDRFAPCGQNLVFLNLR